MGNIERLTKCFVNGLRIPAEKVKDELHYNTIPQWDSVAHMTLVAAIEEEFDLMLDTDDIIAMSSVGKAKEILKKYGIDI